MSYRLWVNSQRTLLVRQWSDGLVEFAKRDDAGSSWGPPREMTSLPWWIANLTEEPV